MLSCLFRCRIVPPGFDFFGHFITRIIAAAEVILDLVWPFLPCSDSYFPNPPLKRLSIIYVTGGFCCPCCIMRSPFFTFLTLLLCTLADINCRCSTYARIQLYRWVPRAPPVPPHLAFNVLHRLSRYSPHVKSVVPVYSLPFCTTTSFYYRVPSRVGMCKYGRIISKIRDTRIDEGGKLPPFPSRVVVDEAQSERGDSGAYL